MTAEQRIASDPTHSAWVSASAGTGKTKVLTDRVLRLLLAGSAPASILCITYTKAAAAEMQTRVEEHLSRWAVMEEAALARDLEALTGNASDAPLRHRARKLFSQVLDAAERMRIQTIHSFCQSVLARFPLEAGIPPHFTVIEEQTAQKLLRDARMELFAQEDERIGQALALLASLISEEAMDELLEDIVENRRKFLPWFEMPAALTRLRERLYEALGVADGLTEAQLMEKHFRYAPEEENALKQACAMLMESEAGTDVQTRDHVGVWLADRSNVEAYFPAFRTQKGEMRKTLCTAEIAKRWPMLKPILQAEQRRVFAFLNERQSLRVAEASANVALLAERLLDIYRRKKALHNYLDFDDLIHYARKLLKGDGAVAWVLYKLDGGIDHLLLDEAQDTSPEQWDLVEALTAEFFSGEGARSRNRTLFVVGDEKQSIFSFRGARPEAFDAFQRLLSKRILSAEKGFKRVRLDLSFRSTPPVLQVVDAVFALEAAQSGMIFTESVISHTPHREKTAGSMEFWPLVEAPPRQDTNAFISSPERLCAEQIADTIAQWLKERHMLAARGRAVTAGDIMILVQRRGTFDRAMLRALKRRNIPVAGADRLQLLDDLAVLDCLALADFLLLPQDDLTLATMLKSPLIGLGEEGLFELAHGRGEASLWQRLRENKRYSAAYDFLSDLLAKVDYLRPYELFAHVLETCGGRRKLAERLGPEILDPLDEFLSFALRYDRQQPASMQGFVQWMRGSFAEIKRDMEKTAHSVRILTVHAAKGLQAPIVFLPDTTRMPQSRSKVLWQEGNPPLPLWSPFTEYDDPCYAALRAAAREDGSREYRRLLYVAMTRAEDELYVCGWKGAKAVPTGCWYELIRQGTEGYQETGDGKRILVSAQEKPVAVTHKVKPHEPALPNWVHEKAPPELEGALPLTPSRIEESRAVLSPVSENLARERGLLIHRMLQYLPELEDMEREAAAERFIAHYGKPFGDEEKQRMKKEVLGILQHPDFAPVFSPDSVAEAPISGVVEDSSGKRLNISGQIDRLAVTAKDVYIIDYKTNREVPQTEAKVPRGHLRQMEAYRRLIAGIYPDKTIHCALLWTSAPKLMVLPEGMLSKLVAA